MLSLGVGKTPTLWAAGTLPRLGQLNVSPIPKYEAEPCIRAGEQHRPAQGSGSLSHLPLRSVDLLHPHSGNPGSLESCGFDGGGKCGRPPHPPPFPQWRRRKHNKKNKIYKRGSNYSVATKGCLLRAIIMWLNLTPRAAVWGGGV